MEDLVPPGAVPISRIDIVEYLDAETGEYLIAERYWTADEQGMPLFKKLAQGREISGLSAYEQ